MNGSIKITARPNLRSPNLLAAWPGIGNVATILTNYVKAKLPFKELGYLEASHFFDPIGVLVKDSVVEAPNFPQSRFYYWKNDAGDNDLILFIGDDQPVSKSGHGFWIALGHDDSHRAIIAQIGQGGQYLAATNRIQPATISIHRKLVYPSTYSPAFMTAPRP